MGSFGEYLKAERESRNLTLEKVSESTKIRKQFLQAIEEDRYDFLPPFVYVKGFLTTYARYLGLDPNDVIIRFKEHMKTLALPMKEESKKGKTSPKKLRKGVNLRLIAILILVVLSATILIFFLLLKPVQKNLILPGKKENPTSSISSSPPTQKEAETQADQSEKSQTSTPTKEQTNRAIQQESVAFEVLEAELGTGLGRKDNLLTITGKSSEFPCNNQKVYFLARIKGTGEGEIVIVWFRQDKEFHRKEIEIKPPMAVHSSITLKPRDRGDWAVEIRHMDKVLSRLSFKAVELNLTSAFR